MTVINITVSNRRRFMEVRTTPEQLEAKLRELREKGFVRKSADYYLNVFVDGKMTL